MVTIRTILTGTMFSMMLPIPANFITRNDRRRPYRFDGLSRLIEDFEKRYLVKYPDEDKDVVIECITRCGPDQQLSTRAVKKLLYEYDG